MGPKSVLDSLLRFVPGGRYVHYHQLPTTLHVAISYVLDQVVEQALHFKAKYGFSPCLFIDGVDLLGKNNPEAFIHLVDRAKYLANRDTLRLILVSSEGSILPLLQQTSSTTREARVVEVADIPDEKAEKYLSKSMPEDIAKAVVKETGEELFTSSRLWKCTKRVTVVLWKMRSTQSWDIWWQRKYRIRLMNPCRKVIFI